MRTDIGHVLHVYNRILLRALTYTPAMDSLRAGVDGRREPDGMTNGEEEKGTNKHGVYRYRERCVTSIAYDRVHGYNWENLTLNINYF
jgi:hypothetical protein